MERNLYLNWEALVDEAIKRRKQQRLTQRQLAILAEVSTPTVNKFEQRKTTITLAAALKILHMLGLAVEPSPTPPSSKTPDSQRA